MIISFTFETAVYRLKKGAGCRLSVLIILKINEEKTGFAFVANQNT